MKKAKRKVININVKDGIVTSISETDEEYSIHRLRKYMEL